MPLTVVSAVCCENVSATWPYTLERVRFRWASPPDEFCVWVQVQNLSEKSFTWRFEVTRVSDLVYASEDELILSGSTRVERFARFQGADLEAKTYRLNVVLNDVVASSFLIDLGSKELP